MYSLGWAIYSLRKEILANYVLGKNVGNVAAEHIHFPDKVRLTSKGNIKGPFQYVKITDNITLGPGDFFYAKLALTLEKTSIDDAIKEIEHLKSDSSKGITNEVFAIYKNAIDTSKQYKTIVQYQIHNEDAILLKSEMIDMVDSGKQ